MSLMSMMHALKYPRLGSMITREINEDERKPYEERLSRQSDALRPLIVHTFTNIPFYRELAARLQIDVAEIQTVGDLYKLPIVTRHDLQSHASSICFDDPKGYILGKTGGTTGEPLHYRMSKESYYRGVAVTYNGWARGGYRRGDKVMVMAGGSIVGKPSARARLHQTVTNMYPFSTCGITEGVLRHNAEWLMQKKPLFLYGYASSISYFADYLIRKNMQVSSVKACFTTSDPLLPIQRKIITEAFAAPVFDGYSLNDGGVGANECECHNGMHIDTFRSHLQVCREDGTPAKVGEEGRIIATDLYNYAFPFIRYDTGDLCVLDDAPCPCGRTSPRIVAISGRSAEALTFRDSYVNGSALTVLMGRTGCNMYKIVQKTPVFAEVHMLFTGSEESLVAEKEEFVRQAFATHAPEAEIKIFVYRQLSDFPKPENKHRHIINECRNPNE